MTTTTVRIRPTLTLVETNRWSSVSSAPNGSVRNVTDYYTELVFNEVWPEYQEPEISSYGLAATPTGRMRRGTYSGAVYRRTERYLSSTPTERGQLIGSGSGPWPAK